MINAVQFRELIEKNGKIAACQKIRPKIRSDEEANGLIWIYVQNLLQARKYAPAAIVLWGDKTFNPYPECVQRVWNGISTHAKTGLMGAGSLSKSYTGIAWHFLDWLADPFFTSVKLISTTSGHTKANTFSTLVRLHKLACIPLPGIPVSNYLGLDTSEKKSGISVVAIPAGDDGKGRLKGFHPDPRPEPHPVFGPTMRIRVYLDECEDIPLGVHEGLDNMMLSQNGVDSVKATMALNPKDITSKVARALEPKGGWDTFDIETGVAGKDEWMSKEDWFVVRLDAKKSENVRERKVIYTGFQTFEGYKALETRGGGNTPEYHSQARGAYPRDGVNAAIISQSVLSKSRGEFVFLGRPVDVASVDTALDGRDECVLTKGRAGLATAFRHKSGEIIKFSPRIVAQADQQFALKKGDIKVVGDDIIKNCKALNVSNEYFGMDSTGNGSAVWAYICAQWGPITGVCFSEPATEKKILTEDKVTPIELYDGVVTEVWYLLRFWMEFGYFAIAPGVQQDPLEPELLGRRYQLGIGKKLKVEKKDDYKLRLGHSPDHADSLTIFPYVVRERMAMFASMIADKPKTQPPPKPKHGIVDKKEWLTESV